MYTQEVMISIKQQRCLFEWAVDIFSLAAFYLCQTTNYVFSKNTANSQSADNDTIIDRLKYLRLYDILRFTNNLGKTINVLINL